MHTFSWLEVVALISAGYVTGLSICSGFILSALQQIYVVKAGSSRMILWASIAIMNIVLCSLSVVFLIVFLVYRGDPASSVYWLRLSSFGGGILLGSGFSFCAVHLFKLQFRKRELGY